MIEFDNLPMVSGIYFLYENESLLYIGRTNNIKQRIKHHFSVNRNIGNSFEPSHIDYMMHRINKIEFYEYPSDDLLWIEMFYICKLKPLLNSETRKSYPILDQFLSDQQDIAFQKLRAYDDAEAEALSKEVD